MKNYIKNLFKEANKRIHQTLLSWLDDPEYRAQLFVDAYMSQIIEKLNKEEMSYKDFADELGKTRASITQFLDSDAGISVRRLFEYADALNLTIEHPKLTDKDFETIYEEYLQSEIENSFVEFVNVKKQLEEIDDKTKLESSESDQEEKQNVNLRYGQEYNENFYAENMAV